MKENLNTVKDTSGVMNKYYYVYYSYEEYGRGYIGKRECECLPEKDVNYFGSFKDKTFKYDNKCYNFTTNNIVCDKSKNIIEFE